MRKVIFEGVLVFLFTIVLFLDGVYSQGIGSSYDRTLNDFARNITTKIEGAQLRSGAVLDFTDLQGQGTVLGRLLSQELSDRIVANANSFSLVDRTNLQFLLRENKLSMDGFIDPSSRRRLGNMIGIDTVIFGSVTPIGPSVRLSVRSVSVETGKIVSAASALIPVPPAMLELYNQGLPSTANALSRSGRNSQAASQFRNDSIRIVGKYVEYEDGIYGGAAGDQSADATAAFVFENLSGKGFEAAIKDRTVFIGSCSGTRIQSATGLNYYRYNFKGQKTFIPANARIHVNIKVGYCRVERTRTVDIGSTITISLNGKIVNIPVSATNVPIRN